MTQIEKTQDLFKKGYSWTQSLLAGFGQKYGLDQDMAITIGRAFGSGMGLGKICGAVSGAFMVLGFKYQNENVERQARYKTYDLVKEFVKRFEEKHSTTNCKELLGGVNLSTEKGRQEALNRKLFTTLCPEFVKDAANILDDLLR